MPRQCGSVAAGIRGVTVRPRVILSKTPGSTRANGFHVDQVTVIIYKGDYNDNGIIDNCNNNDTIIIKNDDNNNDNG